MIVEKALRWIPLRVDALHQLFKFLLVVFDDWLVAGQFIALIALLVNLCTISYFNRFTLEVREIRQRYGKI